MISKYEHDGCSTFSFFFIFHWSSIMVMDCEIVMEKYEQFLVMCSEQLSQERELSTFFNEALETQQMKHLQMQNITVSKKCGTSQKNGNILPLETILD